MKTKCKPVHSQAMQLQIHPGLDSKPEDVKSLVWLTPFLREKSCIVPHCTPTQNCSVILCTTGLLVPLQHYPSHKNYFSANTTGALPREDFLCLLIYSLRCQSSLCISFMVNPALDLSHFSTLISAGLLYTALLFT